MEGVDFSPNILVFFPNEVTTPKWDSDGYPKLDSLQLSYDITEIGNDYLICKITCKAVEHVSYWSAPDRIYWSVYRNLL